MRAIHIYITYLCNWKSYEITLEIGHRVGKDKSAKINRAGFLMDIIK